jgi:hypothetical protein
MTKTLFRKSLEKVLETDISLLKEKPYCNIFKYHTWKGISRYIELDEEFIEKFQDKLDWDMISKYQKFSEEFIAKFIHLVDNLYNLVINENIPFYIIIVPNVEYHRNQNMFFNKKDWPEDEISENVFKLASKELWDYYNYDLSERLNEISEYEELRLEELGLEDNSLIEEISEDDEW